MLKTFMNYDIGKSIFTVFENLILLFSLIIYVYGTMSLVVMFPSRIVYCLCTDIFTLLLLFVLTINALGILVCPRIRYLIYLLGGAISAFLQFYYQIGLNFFYLSIIFALFFVCDYIRFRCSLGVVNNIRHERRMNGVFIVGLILVALSLVVGIYSGILTRKLMEGIDCSREVNESIYSTRFFAVAGFYSIRIINSKFRCYIYPFVCFLLILNTINNLSIIRIEFFLMAIISTISFIVIFVTNLIDYANFRGFDKLPNMKSNRRLY